MNKYRVAVLGCGAIFSRHLQAIQGNPEYYELVGLYDLNTAKLDKFAQQLNVRAYNSEQELYMDNNINCVAVITPSYLHYEQIIRLIKHNKHIIVEKPATFLSHELEHIEQLAKQHGVNVFTILQVRLNPSLIAVKDFIANGYLGNLRGVSLVQRWQRPLEYFTGWRGSMSGGGGVLREFSIHYLDALISLIGTPQRVTHAGFYKTKFKHSDVYDTIYAHFDFGQFGGNFEVSVSAEPSNLECSLSIMSEHGCIKLGGKSLDIIVEAKFLNAELNLELDYCLDQALKSSMAIVANTGASPYHPELYRQIATMPDKFRISETLNVIKLIEQIYSLA